MESGTETDTQQELFGRLLQQQGEPPDCLYHYTTADGLLGIVSTGTLWATGIRYLNDSSEYEYTLDIARDHIESVSKLIDQPLHRALLEALLSALNVTEIVAMYVACLSEHSDQLSQWRAYGRGAGYAVGISPQALSYAHTPTLKAGLLKCVYDKKKQHEHLTYVMNRMLQAVGMGRDASVDIQRNVLRRCEVDFAGHLTVAAAVFKHASFAEEAEWRLVARGDSGPHHRRFRTQAGVVVPYIELPVAAPDTSVNLESITVGPSLHGTEAELGLKALLEERRVSVKELRHSSVPYRSW